MAEGPLTERWFPCCVVCGSRLSRGWFTRSNALRRRRWGFSLRFGGRGRIRRGTDLLVEEMPPETVKRWLGDDHVTLMAAAIFDAGGALQRAGWSLRWAMADARDLDRLRYLDAMVAVYGKPVAVVTVAPAWQPQIEDRRGTRVEASPSLRGDAVLEVCGGFGDATVEDRR